MLGSLIAALIGFSSQSTADSASISKEPSQPASLRWVARVSGGAGLPTNNNPSHTLILFDGISGHSVYQGLANTPPVGFLGVFGGAELPLAIQGQGLSWQFGISFYQTNTFKNYGLLAQTLGAATQDYVYRYSLRSEQVMLENKLLLVQDQIYHPYGSVGLGASFNRTYGYQALPVIGTYGPSPTFRGKTTTPFSYSLGLGLDVDLSSHLRGGLGYRYVDYGVVALGLSAEQNTTARLKNNNYTTSQFIAELTFIM